jgi:adenylyltransferase/sulfurtransferase
MLSEQERLRYNRQIILPEIGVEGQEKLKKARVLVIGAGGLGCPASLYLTAAGVGTIGIMDYDIVEESNLQRQILFTHEDIGKSKAEMAAKKLKQLNTLIKITAIPTSFTIENALDSINDYDIVVDGTDNFTSRYLINDACVIKNKPYVFGSISRFEGQVSVFNYKDGPTYRCLYPEPANQSEDCSTIGVLPALPGIIGSILANEAIKIITETGEVLSGKLLIMETKSMQTTFIRFLPVPEYNAIKKLENLSLTTIQNSKFKIQNLSYAELQDMLQSHDKIQLIDVRETAEHEEFNIGGINIPFSELADRIKKLDSKQKTVLYCSNGTRSKHSAALLNQNGFEQVYTLEGGIELAMDN